ncbi:unnamed protein product [Trichogramma brassicae]|uniref:Uncharacterized protein n=1 Tax=Trichogramma brassicae TaxID=86971 RepID=A0A6H5I004_9HYME|nr:unnamed protein product [Trichogramma brassicae]
MKHKRKRNYSTSSEDDISELEQTLKHVKQKLKRYKHSKEEKRRKWHHRKDVRYDSSSSSSDSFRSSTKENHRGTKYLSPSRSRSVSRSRSCSSSYSVRRSRSRSRSSSRSALAVERVVVVASIASEEELSIELPDAGREQTSKLAQQPVQRQEEGAIEPIQTSLNDNQPNGADMGQNYPGGRDLVSKALKLKGIPEECIEISLSSLCKSSLKQYEACFQKWWSFCLNRNLNLNHCEAAQDLLCDTISKLRIDVAILCEQYKNLAPPNTWLADADGQAAIWVHGGIPVQERQARVHPYFAWA